MLLDPRTRDWFLIPSPVPGGSLLIGYLYFILSWGPRHMEHRKPYQLKNILVFYNLLQVLLSFWLFYEGLDAAWLRKYSWKCQPVDYSNSPDALRVFLPFLITFILYFIFHQFAVTGVRCEFHVFSFNSKQYEFIVGRQRRVHLFLGEAVGTSGHSVLRSKEERETDHVPTLVPSYRDADGFMGRHQILSGRTWHLYR